VNWLTIKAKLYALGALILAAVGFFIRLKVVKTQRDNLKEKVAVSEARIRQADRLRQRDTELEEQSRSRRADVLKQVESEGVSDELKSPNDW
jgi:hypothetical protein